MRLVAACGYGDSIEIGGSMFWRAMEGLLEKERHQKERGIESTKESEKESEKEERNNKNL